MYRFLQKLLLNSSMAVMISSRLILFCLLFKVTLL
jgi:hypothetical protein